MRAKREEGQKRQRAGQKAAQQALGSIDDCNRYHTDPKKKMMVTNSG